MLSDSVRAYMCSECFVKVCVYFKEKLCLEKSKPHSAVSASEATYLDMTITVHP